MSAFLHGFALVSAEGTHNIDSAMNAVAVLSSARTNSQDGVGGANSQFTDGVLSQMHPVDSNSQVEPVVPNSQAKPLI